MRGCFEDVPDWRNDEAYAGLLKADRSAFAWEWLRRVPEYRDQALAAADKNEIGSTHSLAWGLHQFEDPHHSFVRARPIWSAQCFTSVVRAEAQLCSQGEECFNPAALSEFVRTSEGKDAEHILLSDGFRSIRLDVSGAPLTSPVRLTFMLSGMRSLSRPLTVLHRLRSLVMLGRFTPALYPPFSRARRLITLIRAFDALKAGANQQDIATILLAGGSKLQHWRHESPSLRAQAQRLVRSSKQLAQGGFWLLLAGSTEQSRSMRPISFE